ncbi:MAG: serine/threonine-protein kinase [Kofleriaceae bacterium]|nr:serine/threonine-protein kinase [Kofleriaceae bacterium]
MGLSLRSSRGDSTAHDRLPAGGSGVASGFDAALAGRVRLYLATTFFINVLFAGAAISTRIAGAARSPATRSVIMLATIAANGLAWFLVAKSRSGAASSPHVAGFTTLLLSAVYTQVAISNAVDPNPTRSVFFLLFAVACMLVLRASIIPSPTTATVVVGVLCVAPPLYYAHRLAIGSDRFFLAWAIAAALVVVAVTAVTSSTVYGLDRRMRAATRLGQYQLERLLGRGGMGEVYLGTHALLRRPTAIKLLRDISSSAMRDLFRQEVLTASCLTHPNTVEIYDYGRTPDGVFYFAMEYVEGATIEEVVRATGPMPASRVVHLLMQAAGSLGEVHARGLVHRDVKPSNLMLCERGGIHDTLKVMDFGLVRDLTDGAGSDESALEGTPLYLAPEMILEADGVVPQSDVYALGATAYFLLTGEPPFAKGDLVEILSDHLTKDPAPFDCEDAALARLVHRCLLKDPQARPSHAKELARELERCASFGEWKPSDAEIWWAEHGAVIAARQPETTSTARSPSEIQNAPSVSTQAV